MKHIKGLDALRAFAVVFVIISHWGPGTVKIAPLNFIFSKLMPDGAFGVDLFFVLSGYLITKILLNARDETLPDQRLQIVKSFYIRRMLRIFPIYFLLIFIVAYILDDAYTRNHILYFVTYTSNLIDPKDNGRVTLLHTWSLAVEEQFYLIWPWIIIYTPKKHLLKVILISIAIGLTSCLAIDYKYGEWEARVLLLPCITAFAIGALWAHVQTYQQFEKIFINTALILLPACLILQFINHNGDNRIILIRAVNSVIAVNAIVYTSRGKYNQVTKYIFNNNLLVKIGKVSYGMYLYHFILPKYYYLFINFLQHKIKFSDKVLKIITLPPPAYLIHLGLLFLITILSYNYIELAFLRLKKHFNYVSDKRRCAATVNVQ